MHRAAITRVDPGVAGPFRYRVLDGRYLISNDFGDWTFLSPEELKAFAEGDISPGDDLYDRLKALRFIHGEIVLDEAVARYRSRHSFLHHGPSQHVLALTSRAGSSDDDDPDMSLEIADRAVDCAFMSTSPGLTFILRGGDPLVVSEAVRHVVQYVEDKNKLARKEVRFVLQSPLTQLDDEMAAWMADHPMELWVPEDSADLSTAGSTRAAISRIRAGWSDRGHSATVTLQADLSTLEALSPTELVDLAVDSGFDVLDLAPVPSWDFMGDDDAPALSRETWNARWEEALEQMIQQESNGRSIMERTAAEVLSGALGGASPAVPSLRTPALDGIGQLAYHWCGRVFASDLGREVFVETEDELFQVGELRHHGYHDMITGATVRSLLMASVLDGQPGWTQWVYKPWGGLWPAANYVDQGSIHGRMADSAIAQKLTGMMDALFRRLGKSDSTIEAIFHRWGDVSST